MRSHLTFKAMKMIVLAGFLACGLVASEASAASKQAPTTAPQPLQERSMAFAVARLATAACEPSCPEWIVADGKIMDGTAAAFAHFLSNPAYRKLPVILNSHGGKIYSAMAMGRMIRKYGMNTAIGYTSFVSCSPFETTDGTCKPSADTHAFQANVFAYRAQCFSACPLILLGGVTRIVDRNAAVGLHEPVDEPHPYVDHFWITWRMEQGKKHIISRKFVNRTYLQAKTLVGVTPRLKQKLLPYFKELGGSPAIIDEMGKAGPKDINLIVWSSGAREKLGLVTNNYLDLRYFISPDHCKFGALNSNCIDIKERKPQDLPLADTQCFILGGCAKEKGPQLWRPANGQCFILSGCS